MRTLFLLFVPPLLPVRAQEAGRPPKELKPMQGREWMSHYRAYQQKAGALAADASADEHFELGQWAFDQRLEDEAWDHWIRAVGLDSNHEKARKAMGYVREGDAWTRPGKVDPDRVKAIEEDGRAFSFTVAVEDDADEEWFRLFSWRLRRLNWFIWDMTAGQMYLKELTLADKSGEGRLIIEKGKLNLTLLRGGGAMCHRAGRPDWFMRSGGRCYVRILCHEFFHGILGLPDERGGCPCLMQGGLYGIRLGELGLCVKDTHRDDARAKTPCWDLIRKRYPKMKAPDGGDVGRPPEVKITVKNN